MKMVLKSLLSLLVAFGFIFQLNADDLLEITKEGVSSSADSTVAREEIFESVSKEVALEAITELLGKEKVTSSQRSINENVLKKKDRFIPFIKGGTAVKEGGKTKIPVTLRFSRTDLIQILKAEGFLQSQEGPAGVLPMIVVVDEVGSQSYKWWYGDDQMGAEFVKNQTKVIMDSLKTGFSAKGFYLIDPVQWKTSEWFDPAIRRDSYRRSDYSFIGNYFGAQVILTGRVRFFKDLKMINKNVIEFRLVAHHTGTSRIVGEVIRVFPTEAGAFETVVSQGLKVSVEEVSKELADQVFAAWKEGVLDSNRVRFTLLGKLSFDSLEKIKKEMPLRLKEVKSVKERLFEDGKVVLEVESGLESKALGAKISGMTLPGVKFSNVEVSTNEVRARVQQQ